MLGVIFQAVIMTCTAGGDDCNLTVSIPFQSEAVCESVLGPALDTPALDKALAAGVKLAAKCVAFSQPYRPYKDPDHDGRVIAKVLNIDPPSKSPPKAGKDQ